MPSETSDLKWLAARQRAHRKELLRRSGAKRHSRMVPSLGLRQPGDFHWTVQRHHRPDATVYLSLRISTDEHVGYEIAHEPVTGWWLVLESGTVDPDWRNVDVFDQLWEARGSIAVTREDAIACALLTHGFLAPWISTTTQAGVIRRRLANAPERWEMLFTDPADLDTRECDGCGECVVEGVKAFHRVRA